MPRWVAALCVVALAGCASSTIPTPTRPIVLFGEVHDNAAQHRMRLAVVEAMLRSGARPALLLEQFDRERQGDIDLVLARRPLPDADAVIAAGSGAPPSDTRSWNWPFYRPLIMLALANNLPIVAANVSRSDTRQIIGEGLQARGFDPAVADDITEAQSSAIEASHCGMLDRATARRMSTAQVARDQFMARMVEAQADRGVVLLAGNGHVRTDIGVPRWLTPATRAKTESIGMLEAEPGERPEDASAYDRVIVTPRQPRADPCAAMRR